VRGGLKSGETLYRERHSRCPFLRAPLEFAGKSPSFSVKDDCMTPRPAPLSNWHDPGRQLAGGQDILRAEAQALLQLAARLDANFTTACQWIFSSSGAIFVTGVGKAGLVGQKIAATLASTGTRAHVLHPTEALHGDLGRVQSSDIILALSFRGETEELNRLLPSLQGIAARIIAVTSRPRSTLGKGANLVLDLGPIREACPLGLAPSTSTTAMLALGDALALVVSRMREFSAENFGRFHPGGSLGRKLRRVEEAMRRRDECRIAPDCSTVRETLVSQSRPGRRTGAIMLVDGTGRLSGLFTDSDLAKLLERHREAALDGPITAVMTANPLCVPMGTRLEAACDLLADRKISELPVVDAEGRPLGLIDVTDVMALDKEVASAPLSPGGFRIVSAS
jgi:arabinose-5-phosphate isomerase